MEFDNKIENKRLVEKYPFLLPRNRFSGEVVKGYEYEFTELDSMPDGWRTAFGLQMVEEISQILKKVGYDKKYRIAQIKEKFGMLRWYDNGYPTSISKELNECIRKYENLSYETCIICGSKADGYTKGWIMPVCKLCHPVENIYSEDEVWGD